MDANSFIWTLVSGRGLIQASQRLAVALSKLGLVTRDECTCFQGNSHKGVFD